MAYFLNNLPPVNQYTKTTKEKYFVDKSEFIEKMNEMFQENGFTSDGRVVVEEVDTDKYKITVLENSTTINTEDLTDYGIMMEIMKTIQGYIMIIH